jgi:hypothetical protein
VQWSMSGNWINPLLGEWLSSLLRGTAAAAPSDPVVTFGAPGPDGGPPASAVAGGTARAKRGINLHLLSVAPHEQATTRIERRTESKLVLRYLVTSWAEQSDVADAQICKLAFHLLENGAHGPDGRSDVAIEGTPAPEVLAALGVTPRAALIVGLPLVHINEPPPARRVLHPPTVHVELAESLVGQVVGPNEAPVPSAQVEFPALGLVSETDRDGWFRFARCPADLTGQTIRVRARGAVRTFQLSGSAIGADRSVILQMTFGEEG